ncbi:hypothetical protein EGT47_04910 [Burkholderia cenocepacia]|nr:hypothetical protein EGT47_04910 [Burkholderia cenocepacia]
MREVEMTGPRTGARRCRVSLTVAGPAAHQRERRTDDACDVRMIAWIGYRAHRSATAGRRGFRTIAPP